MPKSRIFTSSELIKILEKHNFVCIRQKGSHKIFKKEGFFNIVVPVHPGIDLKKGLVNRILKDTKINLE
jgi:predicted RNA binding protein YcfA (HicA-like mRNA interferase family)